MKIIFLDIDGVLNVINQGRDEFGHKFNPKFVENLKTIIDQTNAKIVISSTWRNAGLAKMQLMWEVRDLPGEVIDITPNFRHTNAVRGEEIAEWLRLNEVDRYVILDDDTDMLPEQIPYFVCCSGGKRLSRHIFSLDGYGLTKERAMKAIETLNASKGENK